MVSVRLENPDRLFITDGERAAIIGSDCCWGHVMVTYSKNSKGKLIQTGIRHQGRALSLYHKFRGGIGFDRQ